MSAAVGFAVKSGWAVAVVAKEEETSIRVLQARRVDLCDPAVPESKQPYHDGFATMRRPGPVLTKLVRSVRRFGERSVSDVLEVWQNHDAGLVGVGLVVGSLIDPTTIGNEHIRIHALEGRLFREVIVAAVQRRNVPCEIWRERDLVSDATRRLQRTEASIRRTLSASGHEIDGPWRAEQKAAALAAWLILRRT
jgi:hypothetical protein